jgi:hypothetical protein
MVPTLLLELQQSLTIQKYLTKSHSSVLFSIFDFNTKRSVIKIVNIFAENNMRFLKTANHSFGENCSS